MAMNGSGGRIERNRLGHPGSVRDSVNAGRGFDGIQDDAFVLFRECQGARDAFQGCENELLVVGGQR